MKVYLSSTLNDLIEERKAATEALVKAGCSVRDSYAADERSLRESCLDDVATCDALLLILGLRYGFVPTPDVNDKSITLLEYERAREKGLPRFVFLKKATAITADKTDAFTRESPDERIEGFRARFTAGGDDEPRATEFTTPENLRWAVAEAIAEARQRRSGTTPILSGQLRHPWQVNYDLSICALPGTDDDLQLPALNTLDRRVGVSMIGPQPEHEYIVQLDRVARRSRCVFLVLRPQSLSRLGPHMQMVAAALSAIRSRAAVFALLVDLQTGAVPAPLATMFDDLFDSSANDWSLANREATLARLVRWRRERVPEDFDGSRIGVPYLIVALSQSEAESMHGQPDPLFARFGAASQVRRSVFDELRRSLTATGANWPDGFYSMRREEWRPFGPATPTVQRLIEGAARKVNAAPAGGRERRILRDAHVTPQRYRFEEYLNDAFGSGDNLKRICDDGCLVLVDEFALLHPDLRPRIDALLSSNNAAVVSISACDPLYRSLHNLLDEFSYLKIGNLFLRFSQAEDVRCELALNSVARLQRWLRFVLPELTVTLGQQQSDPALVDRADALFSS